MSRGGPRVPPHYGQDVISFQPMLLPVGESALTGPEAPLAPDQKRPWHGGRVTEGRRKKEKEEAVVIKKKKSFLFFFYLKKKASYACMLNTCWCMFS